ncbi:MAG: hypothetical protein DWQ05_15920 [Calditrichaeota bacterium]|nr:MAG: hypothetical protein DWQ05_15920 [Calditrichota bacterium]
MRMKSIGILLIFAGISFSCDSHDHGKSHDQAGENHENHGAAELKLNNGKKWQMDDHTRQSIQNINQLVAENNELKAIADFQKLGKSLDTELNGLIKGCTMQGEAHDQLHAFLADFIPKIAALKEGVELDHAHKTHKEITELLTLYGNTFE